MGFRVPLRGPRGLYGFQGFRFGVPVIKVPKHAFAVQGLGFRGVQSLGFLYHGSAHGAMTALAFLLSLAMFQRLNLAQRTAVSRVEGLS